MAKPGEITITYQPEKIAALNAAFIRKGLSFTDELTKHVETIYKENVSDDVQFLIAINLGEEPPPPKERRTRKNKADSAAKEGENDKA